jgi:hypothetical protein
VLPTGTKGSPTTYYKRIAPSTQSDVLCRWEGEEAMREAGGHEFESPQPHTRTFHVKNRVVGITNRDQRPPFSPGSFNRD